MLCLRRKRLKTFKAFAQSTATQTTLVVVSVICVDNLDNKFLSWHFNSSVSASATVCTECSTVYRVLVYLEMRRLSINWAC